MSSGIKIYCRVGKSLRGHIDREVQRSGETIIRVFESAIDHACGHAAEFAALLGARYHRKKGRRLAGPNVPVGTAVSAVHHQRLHGLCGQSKRFVSDVIETALILYLRYRDEILQARLGLDEFLDPAIVLQEPPWVREFRAPQPGSSLAAIPAGSHVLLDSPVLFAALFRIQGETGTRAFSGECANLMGRCRTGEVRGMVAPQTVANLWTELLAAAPAELTGLIRRFQSLCRSRLEILEVSKDDLETVFGQDRERLRWGAPAELALAAARRHTAYPLVVATASDQFDHLAAAGPAGQVRVHKPSDLGGPTTSIGQVSRRPTL